jgi:hypothetical protein
MFVGGPGSDWTAKTVLRGGSEHAAAPAVVFQAADGSCESAERPGRCTSQLSNMVRATALFAAGRQHAPCAAVLRLGFPPGGRPNQARRIVWLLAR